MPMSLTLYDLPHSPFCLPVKRLLDALGQPFQIVDVPNWDRSKVIEITGGAGYEVPVLKHGERVIYETAPDTQNIARYIDTTFAGGALFPPTSSGLQDILLSYLENDVEGATFRCADVFYVPSIPDPVGRVMVQRHKERKFGKGCLDDWHSRLHELRASAALHLARFDAMLQHRPFLLGNQPVYADFLLYGILGNYTYQGWNPMPAGLDALATWQERLTAFRF